MCEAEETANGRKEWRVIVPAPITVPRKRTRWETTVYCHWLRGRPYDVISHASY